jgi:DNA-binding NarL/FixJ family response regulator
MVDFMQFTINTTENDSPSVIRKRIKQKIQSVVDDNFWRELRFYLDKRYNNIISNIAKNPRINETDIRFIELVCCGFSYVEVAITLGYSTNYVSNKRIKIQKKLKLKETLSDYLNQAMKG